jgi:hypothetical protein
MKNWHAGARYRSDWRKKTNEAMAKNGLQAIGGGGR